MAQLSSDFNYFSYIPATADIVIEVDELDDMLPSSISFIFSTNQRPRNYLRQQTTHDRESTYWQALLYEQAPAKITIKQAVAELIQAQVSFPAKHRI